MRASCRADSGVHLEDTIVFPREKLCLSVQQRAHALACESDLALVLGSSLTVPPASNLPTLAKRNNGKLVVVSTQVCATGILLYALSLC